MAGILETVAVTDKEGGKWIPFSEFTGNSVHSISFSPGVEWDCVNGWRHGFATFDDPLGTGLHELFESGEMSTRVFRALQRGNILRIGDLVKQRPSDLLRLGCFGRGSLEEVEKILSARGLNLS